MPSRPPERGPTAPEGPQTAVRIGIDPERLHAERPARHSSCTSVMRLRNELNGCGPSAISVGSPCVAVAWEASTGGRPSARRS